MRILILLLAIMVSGACEVFAQASLPQKTIIRYEEKCQPGNVLFENSKVPSKQHRVSSKRGDIRLLHTEDFPDSIKIALELAENLWESKIYTKQPIYIGVYFEPMDEDISMVSDVIYYGENDPDLFGCPISLASQLKNYLYGDSTNLGCGIVAFNSEIDWDCGFTGNASPGYNLTTMALRGIARCLGFGSSIIELDDNLCYYNGWPTYFDKMLYSGSVYLADLEDFSSEMSDFVKSNNVLLDTPSKTYKVYAPAKYSPSMSLCCLEENNSMMSYDLGEGNRFLSVDEKTLDILDTMGWSHQDLMPKIKCPDISDDGTASSYVSHTFSLSSMNESISDYQWRFLLKGKTGDFINMSAGNSANFTIDKIEPSDNYFTNIDGDYEGRIECEYIIGGERYVATPFSVSLELKPTIISIDNISKIKSDVFSFYLQFNITYTGADNITVEVEEDYDPVIRSYRIDEPFVAHAKTGNISSLYDSWVTVIATNKYGSASMTLDFAPEDYPDANTIHVMNNGGLFNPDATLSKIQIFNMNGVMIYEGSPAGFSEDGACAGLYIRNEIFDNGVSKKSKFVII